MPLEVAASAGARLSITDKADISRPTKIETNHAGVVVRTSVEHPADRNVSTWDRVN